MKYLGALRDIAFKPHTPAELVRWGWFVLLGLILLMGAHIWLGNSDELRTTYVARWAPALLRGGVISFALATAALLLLGGGAVARFGFQQQERCHPLWVELLGAAAVLGLGAWMRLYGLERYPNVLGVDGVANAWIGLGLLEELADGRYTPVLEEYFRGNETAYIYLLGLTVKLLGASAFSLRLPTAIISTLIVLVVYLAARTLFSFRAALAAGFLMAVSPWAISIARSPLRANAVPLALGAALLFYALGHRARSGRRAWIAFGLCGASLGAGLHTYEIFRLFPPALGTAHLLWRWRERRLSQGLRELGLMVLAAVLVAGPVLLFALNNWHDYLGHISTQVTTDAAAPEGATVRILHNLGTVVAYLFLELPTVNAWIPDLGNPYTLVSALLVLGLPGLYLAYRQQPEKLGHGWFALAITLPVMLFPLALANRDVTAPRRFMGVMVPLYLLAGGAAAGVLRVAAAGVGARWRKGLVGLLSLGAVAGLLALYPSVLDSLTEPVSWQHDPRKERLFGWISQQARTKEVYLLGDPLDNIHRGALMKLLSANKRVYRLPSATPLPQGPLRRRVIIVSSVASWGDELKALFGAESTRVHLDVPGSSLQATTMVYSIDPRRLRRHRVPAKRLASGYQGWLVVPHSGTYRFRTASPAGARLTLDGRDHHLRPDAASVPLALGAGLHRVGYGLGKPGRLQWQRRGEAEWRAVPAGLLWELPNNQPLPLAPPAAPVPREPKLVWSARVEIRGEATGVGWRFMDLAVVGNTPYVSSRDRHPVAEVKAGPPSRREPVLLNERGEPVQFMPDIPMLQRAMAPKTLSLDAGKRGLYLLERNKRRVSRYAPDGAWLAAIHEKLVSPQDLAVAGDRVFVADPGNRAVLALSAGLDRLPRPLLQGVWPVSLDAAGGRLAVVDRASLRVLFVDLSTNQVVRRLVLPHASTALRLTLSRSGWVLLCYPHLRQVLLYDEQGRMMAQDGDPHFLRRFLHDEPAVAGVLDEENQDIWLLGRTESVYRLSLD